MFHWRHGSYCALRSYSVSARRDRIWDEVGFRASLSGPKELCQTFTIWTELPWRRWSGCLCSHCATLKSVQEDCCRRAYAVNVVYGKWHIVPHVRFSGYHCWSRALGWALAPMSKTERCPGKSTCGRGNGDWGSRAPYAGNDWHSKYHLPPGSSSACLCLDKLLSFHVFMYQTLVWPFKHHKLNRQKYHKNLKKKITALPKSVWYLPWGCVLQQCAFPIPFSDNKQQYFWGVFAFWSPLRSNAIVHWQKRCEVQNKVMKLIWFPPPNPSIYMPLLY